VRAGNYYNLVVKRGEFTSNLAKDMHRVYVMMKYMGNMRWLGNPGKLIWLDWILCTQSAIAHQIYRTGRLYSIMS
jgi:hypothetical protein